MGIRKYLFLLLFLILVGAFSANAQSTTVSGQVTDAGGQSWNNGTVTANFVSNVQYPTFPQYTWTGGALSPTVSGTLTSTGSYSISIPSSTAITPVGSSWQFQFCPKATAFCFTTANITITGGTQTVNATPPAIAISMSNPPPNTTAYVDSEIIGAAVGQSYFNLTTNLLRICQGLPCTGSNWVNAGGGGNCSGPNCINPLSYGAKFDVLRYTDATWASNGTAVSITANDSPFTSGLTGKLCFGMPGIASGPGAPGTFTFLTATTGTCGPSGALQGAPTGNGAFAVGDDDTAALQAATAAAYALCKQGSGLVLPTGSTFLSAGVGGNGGTNCNVQSPPGTTASGFSVQGASYTSTWIVPLPGFSFSTSGSAGAGCNNGSVPGCFWNNSNVATTYQNFTIDGLGQNGAGITTGLSALFTIGPNGLAINVDLFNWFTTPSVGTAGAEITGSGAYGIGFSVQNFGTTSENLLAAVSLPNYAIMSSGSVTSTLQIGNNAGIQDNQGTYLGLFNNGGIIWGRGTQTLAQGSGSTASTQTSGCSQQNCGNDYLEDCYIAKGSNGTGTTGLIINSGTTVVATRCIFNGGSTGGSVSGAGTFIDQCGNTFLQPFTSWTGIYVPCPTSTPPGGINKAAITGTGACAAPTTILGTMFYGSAVCPGTTGASTFIITPGTTAANGWNCQGVYDKTTFAVPTALTTTTTACTATFASVTANDIILFKIQQF